jgi:hypothetical protein
MLMYMDSQSRGHGSNAGGSHAAPAVRLFIVDRNGAVGARPSPIWRRAYGWTLGEEVLYSDDM